MKKKNLHSTIYMEKDFTFYVTVNTTLLRYEYE